MGAGELGVVELRGRIASKGRKVEQGYYTLLVLPSADEFESAQRVEVRSRVRLGEVDEVVMVRCRVGGYQRKAYDLVDKTTGESRRIVPNTITLDVVDD